MPSVPVTWRDDFIANLNVGSQSDPVITQLASGHILVVWTDSDNTSVPGSPAGTDVIARVFDSQGNAVTNEIRLNTLNTGDNELNPTVTALDNGGFVIAYDRSGGFDDLDIETYSFNPTTFAVTQTNSAFLFFDGGTSNPIDPSIASASSTSVLAAYHTINADGSDNVIVRAYNPTTNTVGAEITIFTGNAAAGEDVSGPDVAALSNGNYAVAFVNQNPAGSTDDIIVHVRNQAGALVNSATVASIEPGIIDPQVAALTSGNFVVAYNRLDGNGDINFRVFSNAGVALTGGGPFSAASGVNSQNEPAVIGLADGTFVIAWDDDTTGQLMGSRYSVSGPNVFTVASSFVIDTTGGGSITEIELEAFADGRFGVTWNDGGDVRVKIMDPRDFVNATAVYAPNSEQVGTVGNDVFTADGGASKVFGHDGNDTITESGSIKQYFGGNGNDTLKVVSAINDDVHDGGSGEDTIDWSLSGVVGATFNLGTGSASTVSDSEVMTGFENLIATNNNDTIFGSGGNNTISALGGNDIIQGGFSTDTIDAGTGNDSIVVAEGEFADNVDGGTGFDTYQFNYLNQKININLAAGTLQVFDSGGVAFGPALVVSNIEKIIGGALDDIITGGNADETLLGGAGNDTMSGGDGKDIVNGGAGADILDGGSSGDTLNYIGSNAAVIVNLVTNVVSGGHAQGDTITSFEHIYGSNFGDTLTGNASANVIRAYEGNDTLSGRSGSDSLFGYGGADNISGGTGGDTMDGGAGADIVDYRTSLAGVNVDLTSNTTSGGDAQDDTIVNFEHIFGSNAGDSLIGNSGVNVLRAYLGDDFVNGRDGNDRLFGYGGADTLLGGSGDDRIEGGVDNDKITGGIGADILLGGAGADLFILTQTAHSTLLPAGRDTILDFGLAQGDRIDFSAIDANANVGGNQTFSFIGTANFTGVAGQLRFVKQASDTFVFGDINGDQVTDVSVHLDDALTMTAGDFIL